MPVHVDGKLVGRSARAVRRGGLHRRFEPGREVLRLFRVGEEQRLKRAFGLDRVIARDLVRRHLCDDGVGRGERLARFHNPPALGPHLAHAGLQGRVVDEAELDARAALVLVDKCIPAQFWHDAPPPVVAPQCGQYEKNKSPALGGATRLRRRPPRTL